MLKYILKRLLQMIPTIFGVILLTFILFNVAGGDLAFSVLGQNATLEAMEEFDVQRGLDRPLFFGTRAKTRAYGDHKFSNGPGQWHALSNTTYSAESKTVRLSTASSVNPLALALNADQEYEWTIRYRGAGRLAGKELVASKKWESATVRFTGEEGSGFQTGAQTLEIKKLKLRKVEKNPFNSQLGFYLKQLSHGNLGTSESLHQPVSKLLLAGVGPSLSLTIPILIIGIIVSVSLALVCAFFRDTLIDRFFVVFAVALMSINYLVYIVVGQYVCAYQNGWFPVWGYESWRYLALPVMIGVFTTLGANLRFYRSVMLEEMYKDYVRTALAKGVSKPRVLFVHVLKNAMIPIITNVVMAIPYLYTGSILLEKYFGIPGLGYLGINAIMSSDVDVVRALVLIGALMFVVSNLITDLCYAVADPRVKLK